MKESKTPEETAPLAVMDRVDRGRFHGWVVRGWKNGEKLKRAFAEESYKSPSTALIAAVRFRNSLASEGGDWSPLRRATGIPGISIGRVRTTAGRYVKHYKESKTPEETAPLAVMDRVDRGRFHGWVVRGWKNGEKLKRAFAEESYKSPSTALIAAVRFRNSLASEGGDWSPSRRATGIPGISIGRVRTTAGRYVKHYKVSVYGADGKRRVKVFSWLKYGKERALRLAKNALREGRAEAWRARRLKRQGKKPAAADGKARSKSATARSKPTEHKNVRRVDHHYFHGYVVSLGRAGSRQQKYFNDGAGRGRRAALARALEYRDALLAKLPPPVRIHRRTNNRTGIPGVSLVNDRTRSGRVVQRFVAHWHNADGRREKRSFSTLEHGFAGAEAKAIRARNAGVAKLFRERKAMLLEELDDRKQRRRKWQESRPNALPPF